MPFSAYKSTWGFAKDTANATLTAAVAAGATTIPVSNTNIPASSTITIIDGPLTEQRAVTAGGGTTSLTVAALTNAHSANAYIVSQLTASQGPADFVPVTVLDWQDTIAQLKDRGLRGSAVEEYGNVQGVRQSLVTIGGDVFPDTFGYFVGGVTGAVDFTGGTPNAFAFSVKNTTDTQPTPFLCWDQRSSLETRMIAGTKLEELQIVFDPAGLLTYTAKMQGWMSGTVANPTPTYSTVTPAPSWGCQATIGGTAVNYVMKADVTVKRPIAPIFTLQGVQDPYRLWNKAQTVEGKFTIVVEDNVQLSNFLNNSQPSLTLLFTAAGANPNTVQVTMTKCNFELFKETATGRSGYLEAEIGFRGLGNLTDATTAGTGYAPCKITVKNTKPTGTYQ